MNDLIDFLKNKMSMTDLYQPAIIRELLVSGGIQSKENLARVLAQYDVSVIDYYKKVLMRWPKITLSKHNVVDYDKKEQNFKLTIFPTTDSDRQAAIELCEHKIAEWVEKKSQRQTPSQSSASVRYEVLKDSQGKCQLCGIPASLRPIDVDHIVPRSKANKRNKVKKEGAWIDVDSKANLQALCFACNRAKRDTDETDFRRSKKLVRDKIPEFIEAEGRTPKVKTISGTALAAALNDKLVEEHGEYIAATKTEKKLEELADMLEVMLAIAEHHGVAQNELMDIVAQKRVSNGGFSKGYFYMGDS